VLVDGDAQKGNDGGPAQASPRRWWLAALVAVLAPPAGQIYNGQLWKGVRLALCSYIAASLAAATTLLHVSLWLPALLFAAAFGLQIYLVVDAIAQAVRIGSDYRPRGYNRWFVFLPLLVVLFFVPRLWLRAANLGVQTFNIPSRSNEPTVLAGDHLFVDRWSLRFAHPRRGDLVIFRSGEGPDLVLKRVVAVGGDRVEIRDKQLLRNGSAVAEPYVQHIDPRIMPAGGQLAARDNLPPQTVPAGSLFVLGDNRDDSWDSRFYGPIREDAVAGGGRLRVYWSWDAGRHASRWQRAGRFLE
jgi:signal peptidase I